MIEKINYCKHVWKRFLPLIPIYKKALDAMDSRMIQIINQSWKK